MKDELKSYLMNCDLEAIDEYTVEHYKQVATERMNSEKYWRDRIAAENS
jgi:hypothetical protein